jgi:cyclase
MLSKRIIPTILCRGRQMVKGARFDSWRTVGLAAQAVRIHQMRGVDEIVLLDVAATAEGRGPDLDMVTELAEVCFMPLAVGGGVRTVDDARALLRAGADKVVIGTAAVELPNLIMECRERIGSQAVVAAIDTIDDLGQVYIRSGTMPVGGLFAEQAAKNLAFLGAGELLLTSIAREGTLKGYDLRMIRAVATAVDIPVIAHGGAGTYQDMLEAIEAGADAVAAGALFQFTDSTPQGAAAYLAERGIETRTPEPMEITGDLSDPGLKELVWEEAQKHGAPPVPREVFDMLWDRRGEVSDEEILRLIGRHQ